MTDILERLLAFGHPVMNDAAAEIERLHERIKQLMGPAERYWELRWRDAHAENEGLRDEIERLRAEVRCQRCGSSGDVYTLCAGCQRPLKTGEPRSDDDRT